MTNTSDISDVERAMLGRREILIEGPINEACANTTIAKLLFLHMQDAKAPISLFINSSGGQVTATLAICDTIGFLDPPVHTYGEVQVNGTALWLLVAGEPGHRCVQKDSWLSIEPTQFGDLDEETLEYARKLNNTLAKLLVSKTGLAEEDVKVALVSGRSFSAEEAIAASIADRFFEGVH